jgi:hypothetical protein
VKRVVACAAPVLLLAWLPQVLTRDLLTFLFFTYGTVEKLGSRDGG